MTTLTDVPFPKVEQLVSVTAKSYPDRFDIFGIVSVMQVVGVHMRPV
jgi:hypothetical protein